MSNDTITDQTIRQEISQSGTISGGIMHKHRYLIYVGCIALLFLWLLVGNEGESAAAPAVPATATSTVIRITGTVEDERGFRLSGASVTCANVETLSFCVNFPIVTDSDGRFEVIFDRTESLISLIVDTGTRRGQQFVLGATCNPQCDPVQIVIRPTGTATIAAATPVATQTPTSTPAPTQTPTPMPTATPRPSAAYSLYLPIVTGGSYTASLTNFSIVAEGQDACVVSRSSPDGFFWIGDFLTFEIDYVFDGDYDGFLCLEADFAQNGARLNLAQTTNDCTMRLSSTGTALVTVGADAWDGFDAITADALYIYLRDASGQRHSTLIPYPRTWWWTAAPLQFCPTRLSS